METNSPSSQPPLLLALLLWLATLGFGAVLLASWVFFRHQEPSIALEESLAITLVCSALAALLSAPILLILPIALRWALGADTLSQRRIRALATVVGLFAIAAFCGFLFLTDGNRHSSEIEFVWFTAPYLPAALLAITLVYRPWLLRP
jgi:hypothetical protein